MKRKTDAAFSPAECHTRRDFLLRAGRLLSGAGLVILGFSLFKKATLPGSCSNNFICRGCRSVGACVFPQALSFKEKTGLKVK
jgi:hypothetical protein